MINNASSKEIYLTNVKLIIKPMAHSQNFMSIPKLDFSLRKGQQCVIGIIGGSSEYTGAPYFAAMAALRTGAEMVHIFCDKEAAIPIKSYSPDIIVHPYFSSTKLEGIEPTTKWLTKFHCIILGPGLSRNKFLLESARAVAIETTRLNIPLIMDADAIALIPDIPHYRSFITPNHNELSRLIKAVNVINEKELALRYPSCRFLIKQEFDEYFCVRSHGRQTIPGVLRRCGGLGDILTGVLSCFVAWSGTAMDEESEIQIMNNSSSLVREACKRAYERKKRGMLASDVLEELTDVFYDRYEN
ncbi:YjeF, carbohydrate kinase-related domain-containing protein [Rozella allomycis CSF55]|uniref:ATP-dependent (S)-NAD(P)H-hydrate dehydratase n=1 Tax=Rozella allomycis (strain CSF55) TaxID=988480 RepID=A0A075ANY2_ROZAC|nr:YjeF, carbohydrate kinase-related domain-containing protein [Rozella allomycis CSF55]|eukprot:EPZ31609.1 YjeF, carbohydrate kinase-related domain-containing protein [Rozella allomycis CSF55]